MKEDEALSHIRDKVIKGYIDESIGTIHSYDIDIKSHHIYLMGHDEYLGTANMEPGEEPGVEYGMANRFIRNLNILMRKTDEPILIHMKSCGGDWSEGMAIYDAIKACPNQICILNYTHARSMTSLIFQAADKRVMMPHGSFMFHMGDMFYGGTAKQFLTEADELKKSNDEMMRIYIDTMKRKGKFKRKSRQFIKDWLTEQMNTKEEVYFDAKQAVEYGFADEVFGLNGTWNWSTLLKFED